MAWDGDDLAGKMEETFERVTERHAERDED